jgi:hypothetical protein
MLVAGVCCDCEAHHDFVGKVSCVESLHGCHQGKSKPNE